MEIVDEQRNKRVAAASTIGIHALLLVFFFFVIGWRPPNPPYPSYGIELNFGLDDQGSGDIQPTVPVGTVKEDKSEETAKEPQQEEKETVSNSKPDTEEKLTAKDETAVPIKEVKKETVVEKPAVKEPEKFTKETTKPGAVYKPPTDGRTDGKTGQPGSHGDDVNKTGDKGSPQGTLDAKALYGKPGGGGGGGSSLSLDGWFWDEVPNVKAPSSESSGRVVFEIKVNSEGEIISIKTLERSLSLEMENSCRREIEKLTFSKTGINVPTVSTGKITFVVLSK